MRLRRESNASSSTRGIDRRTTSTSVPSSSAASTSATSVGSPTKPSGPRRASLHNAATSTKRCTRRSPGSASPGRKLPPAVSTSCTRISFRVSVPVLSVQMTVAAPSDSTAGKRRTTALRSAIFCTPRDRVMVTTAGRPSGMAATASATAMSSIDSASVPRTSPMPNTREAVPRAMTASLFPTLLSSTWSGVDGSSAVSSSAISPMAVPRPVSATTALPRPATTAVPANTMESRSPNPASERTGSTNLGAGSDSPVRAASSLSRWATSITRASAGIRSPAASKMMSPGTTSALGSTRSSPSRITRASGADSSLRASRASAARDSWT